MKGGSTIKEYSITDVDLNIAKSLSKEICEKYNILLVKQDEKKIILVTYESKGVPDYIRFLYSQEIIIELISQKNYEQLKNIIFGEKNRSLDEVIIYNAIEKKASDIHLEPAESFINVRYRINGSLSLVHKIDHDEYLKLCSKIKNEAGMDITEKRLPQDGKIIVNYKNMKYDLRVSTIPVVFGEKIVIRILYCDNFDYKLEDLGFENDKINVIKKMIVLNNGLIIINGPTGSGKSTTLYTILKELDSKSINVTTLEEPVEVYLKNINQINLNKKIGLDFSNGLRSILRQDPDVIMVGEIRDEETAKMAVRASITGHKVYSTIHAKSPKEVYLRLENMGVKDYLINESLVGIISQRLVKILCSKCKKRDKINKFKGYEIYEKCGCEYCNNSGYEGRKIISTVYFLNKEYKKILKDIHMDDDCLSNYNMKKDIEDLLKDGKISYDDYNNFIEGEMLSEA